MNTELTRIVTEIVQYNWRRARSEHGHTLQGEVACRVPWHEIQN